MKDRILIVASVLAVVAYAAAFATIPCKPARAADALPHPNAPHAVVSGDVMSVYPTTMDLVDRSGAVTLIHPWIVADGAILQIDAGGNIVLPPAPLDQEPGAPPAYGAPPVLWALEVNSTYPLHTGDARCDASLLAAMKEAPPHSYVICMRDDRLVKFATGQDAAARSAAP